MNGGMLHEHLRLATQQNISQPQYDDEPCVNSEFYLDAIAVVLAHDLEEALAKLAEENKGWRTEDLRKLPCSVYPADKAAVIFSELRGIIPHL